MKYTYQISQRLVACALIFGLTLQSCTNSLHTVVPKVEKEEERQEHIQGSTQQMISSHLAEKELIASGGHVVTFYEELGQLRAEVAIQAPAGFSKQPYTDLEVKIAAGVDVKQLASLPQKIQQRYIHFQPAESGQSSRVLIHKEGLQGGMKRKRANQAKEAAEKEAAEKEEAEKEAEKEEEKGEETEKSSEHTEEGRQSKRQHMLADENAVDEAVSVLGNFQTIPLELLLIILKYIPFPYIVDCMGINRFFYSFITGYEQVGQQGVNDKHVPAVYSLASWKDDRNVNCDVCRTIPSWYLHCFMREASNLPQTFWPLLSMSQIHTLNLCCSGLGDREVIELGEKLKGSTVAMVVLQTNQINMQGAAAFFQNLKETKVRTVDLTANKIGRTEIVNLAKSLQGTHLQSINLASNKIRTEGAIEFLKNLIGTEVTKVNLASNKIVPDATQAAEMAQSLRGTNIENITLSNNSIELEAAIAFISNLKETAVRTVNLGYNFLEGAYVGELAKSLKDTQVRSIYLNNNLPNNFDRVADCWVDSFSKNLQGSNLITIDLSANTFSAWGLIRLFKNLRETVIEKV